MEDIGGFKMLTTIYNKKEREKYEAKSVNKNKKLNIKS